VAPATVEAELRPGMAWATPAAAAPVATIAPKPAQMVSLRSRDSPRRRSADGDGFSEAMSARYRLRLRRPWEPNEIFLGMRMPSRGGARPPPGYPSGRGPVRDGRS